MLLLTEHDACILCFALSQKKTLTLAADNYFIHFEFVLKMIFVCSVAALFAQNTYDVRWIYLVKRISDERLSSEEHCKHSCFHCS